MCQGLEIPHEHYRIGRTKVFMRRETHDLLEEERSKLLVKHAETIQRFWRDCVARFHALKLARKRAQYMCSKAAAEVLQKCVRRYLARERYARQLQTSSAGQKEADETGCARSENSVRQPKEGVMTLIGDLQIMSDENFVSPNGHKLDHCTQTFVCEDLFEMHLRSLRELYHEERAGKKALFDFVKGIKSLSSAEEIDERDEILRVETASEAHVSICAMNS